MNFLIDYFVYIIIYLFSIIYCIYFYFLLFFIIYFSSYLVHYFKVHYKSGMLRLFQFYPGLVQGERFWHPCTYYRVQLIINDNWQMLNFIYKLLCIMYKMNIFYFTFYLLMVLMKRKSSRAFRWLCIVIPYWSIIGLKFQFYIWS